MNKGNLGGVFELNKYSKLFIESSIIKRNEGNRGAILNTNTLNFFLSNTEIKDNLDKYHSNFHGVPNRIQGIY